MPTNIQKAFLNHIKELQYKGRYKDIAVNQTYEVLCSVFNNSKCLNPNNTNEFIGKLSAMNQLWFSQQVKQNYKIPVVTDFSLAYSQIDCIKNIASFLGYSSLNINNEHELFRLLELIIDYDDDADDRLLPELAPELMTKFVIADNEDGERFVMNGRAYGNKACCVIETPESSIFNNDYVIWTNHTHRYFGNIWDVCNEVKDLFPTMQKEFCKHPQN